MKKIPWKILAEYVLGLGLLAYVINANWAGSNGSPGLKDILDRPVQWQFLILAAVFCAGSMLLTFVRWFVLVRAQHLPFTLSSAFRLGLVGYYFNTFLPGSVGGDIVKAYGIAKEQSRRTASIATVLIDRAIGLWALTWFVALLGGVFWLTGNEVYLGNSTLQQIVTICAASVGGGLLVWALLGFLPERRAERFAGRLKWVPKLGGPLSEFWRAVWMYRKSTAAVATALGLSLVSHTGFVLTFHCAANTFQPGGLEGKQVASVAEHFLIVPVGLTFQALFPSPGGVGGGEAGFAWLYKQVGCPGANGIAGSLSQRAIAWGLALMGYLIYLRMRAAQRRAEAGPADEEPQRSPPLTALRVTPPAA